MFPALAAYAPTTRTVTLTDVGPVVVPSGGTALYSIVSTTPGYAPVTAVLLAPGTAVTTPPVRDGVYNLALKAYDPGAPQAPLSPPLFIDSSASFEIVADGELRQAMADDYDQRARDYLLTGREGDAPLENYLSGFARLCEAVSLVAESAPAAANRLLRQPLPPSQ